jgi:phage terminase Nu1 subunit (DNA packaging protein)
MSQRAYGKRRGVSHVAVQRAVNSGRLRASVNEDGQIVDPDLADREWDAATDLSKAPGYVRERAAARAAPAPAFDVVGVIGPETDAPPSARAGMTLAEASAVEKVWKARQAELNYRQDAGELVPARDVDAKLQDVFRTCRTKLLGLPSRARQALPHLTVADLGTIENLVREALEELASGGTP